MPHAPAATLICSPSSTRSAHVTCTINMITSATSPLSTFLHLSCHLHMHTYLAFYTFYTVSFASAAAPTSVHIPPNLAKTYAAQKSSATSVTLHLSIVLHCNCQTVMPTQLAIYRSYNVSLTSAAKSVCSAAPGYDDYVVGSRIGVPFYSPRQMRQSLRTSRPLNTYITFQDTRLS